MIISLVPIKTTANMNISRPNPLRNACSCVLLNPSSTYLEPTFNSNIVTPNRNLLLLNDTSDLLKLFNINN